MRILVITEIYSLTDEEKYTSQFIKKLVYNWEKQGHEVRIIKPNLLISTYLQKKYYKNGFYDKVENINYFLPFMGNIKKKIKTLFAPDVVIAHGLNGLVFANKLGCSFSAGIGDAELKILTNPFHIYYKKHLEKALKKAHRIACSSFTVKNKISELYPQLKKKLFIAPTGIDENIINERIWLEEEKEKIRVITCGEFIKENHIDKVIKACENIERIELTVIGDGKQNLQKLSDKVHFVGYLSREEILEKLSKSDFFILSSENKDFAPIYLEAMAKGCITICKKNCGIDGIIQDSVNGFLSEDIEGTLRRVIDFPDKNWIIKNGYKTVSTLTESRVAEHYINCLALNTPKI